MARHPDAPLSTFLWTMKIIEKLVEFWSNRR
jgi:hypothetical protein